MAPGAREMAALLACGSGAVVSHLSAAHLHQLLPYPANPGPVDVTVPGRQVAGRPGIRVHRVNTLHQHDLREADGISVTSPARTLLDLAVVLPTSQLERALAEAQVRRVVTRRALLDQLERNPGRSGVRALRSLVQVPGGPAATRSEAEGRLLRLVRSAEMPPPQANGRLGPYEVDLLWRERRLVVEVDGYAYHVNRRAFERDRERDARLAAAGYTVLRVTHRGRRRQLVDAPEAVIARIAGVLAARPKA
jgi:very-short-patch-repair endonuclease